MTNDLLRAAQRIVRTQGPEGLTMERLAKATGRSRATVYRQSGGRDALLDALAAKGTDVGDRAEARERILRAAREVFAKAGFEAASVEEIASAANVGVVTVYRHFGDKDGLVTAFVDELGPRRAVREARASTDVRADLQRLAEQMLGTMREDGALVRLMLLEALKGGSLLHRVRAKSPTRMLTSLTALLRVHMAAGRLREGDPQVLAQAFGGMVMAFGVLGPVLRGDPPPDPEKTAQQLTALFLEGAQ